MTKFQHDNTSLAFIMYQAQILKDLLLELQSPERDINYMEDLVIDLNKSVAKNGESLGRFVLPPTKQDPKPLQVTLHVTNNTSCTQSFAIGDIVRRSDGSLGQVVDYDVDEAHLVVRPIEFGRPIPWNGVECEDYRYKDDNQSA